ncbi:MAG: Ig-like domain-containing protein [bacterium]
MIRRAVACGAAAVILLACGGDGPSGPPGPGAVSSLQITASANTITAGATLSLSATARDASGAIVSGAQVTWSSSATSVATVSQGGVVSGIASGTATITASASGVSSTVQITVTPDDTPASVTLSPASAVALASGSLATLTATVRATDGHTVSTALVSWTSSNSTVATVSAGVVTALKVGTATITATSGSASTSAIVTVTPGPAAELGIQAQPMGAATGTPLSTQPVIEVRDKAGNVVPTATNAVTASIAAGGGTLTGTTTVNAVAGVATFANLIVSGTPGTRTLGFAASGLTSVTSADVVITPSPTALLVIDSTAVTLAVAAGAITPVITLSVKNGGITPLTGLTLSPPSYDAGQPTGWLSVSATGTAAPFVLAIQANATTLAAGTYRAAFAVNAATASNSPVVITVSLIVSPVNPITFGSATEKLRILDIGSAYSPSLSARDAAGLPVPVGTVTFSSRATSVATVNAQGKITAVAEGTTWVVVQGLNAADSVFVIVPRGTAGPVFRSDLTTYLVKAGDVTFVNVYIDTRLTPVGAATVAVGYTTSTPVFNSTVTYTSAAGPPVPVATSPTAGVIRVSVASATPLTGQVALLRLRVSTPGAGLSGVITLTVTDIVAPDGTDLLSLATSTRIPIIVQ